MVTTKPEFSNSVYRIRNNITIISTLKSINVMMNISAFIYRRYWTSITIKLAGIRHMRKQPVRSIFFLLEIFIKKAGQKKHK